PAYVASPTFTPIKSAADVDAAEQAGNVFVPINTGGQPVRDRNGQPPNLSDGLEPRVTAARGGGLPSPRAVSQGCRYDHVVKRSTLGTAEPYRNRYGTIDGCARPEVGR